MEQFTISPDGKTFTTFGQDDKVRIWDSATGKLIHLWTVPESPVGRSWVSDDGRRACVHTRDHLEIWDLPSQKLVCRLPLGDAPEISAAAFSPDSQHLAAADDTPNERRIRLWNLETRRNRVIGGHDDKIAELLWESSGKRLFSRSSAEGLLCCWDLAAGREVWRYSRNVTRMCLDQSGSRLFATGIDGNSCFGDLLDAVTGKSLLEKLWEFNFPVVASVAPDGKTVAIVDFGAIEIRSVGTGKTIREWDSPAIRLGFHPNGETLHVVESRSIVQAYDVKTRKHLYPRAEAWGHVAPIRQIVWSPDRKRIASSAWFGDRHVRVWDAASGQLLYRLPSLRGFPSGLEFSSDSRLLYACGSSTPLRCWNVADGKEVRKWFIIHEDDDHRRFGQILQTKLLRDGKSMRLLLLTNSEPEEPHVATFDLEAGTIGESHRVPIESQRLERAVLTENHLLGARMVFRTATGDALPGLDVTEKDERGDAVVLSPNRSLIAAGAWKAYQQPLEGVRVDDVAVFERATGRLVRELPRGPAGCFDFSPDGRLLAVARADGLHVWDLATGKEVLFHKAHDSFGRLSPDSFATAIAFSPDGKRIATGHPDSAILIWDVPLPPRPKASPLPSDELEQLWSDLASADPKKGMAAVWKLQDRPEQAWKLLSERLKQVAEPVDIKEWIAKLDVDNFRQREVARKRIAEYGAAAGPALRAALKGKITEEQQKHVRKLLADFDLKQPPFGNDLRGIRCLMILERLNTSDARQLLGRLAKGLASSRVTREATETLERYR